MDLQLIRLLFDAGLLVLIWMVQLVIYPSFLFYEKEQLIKWHHKYTASFSIIVIPLMFGQLISATVQAVNATTVLSIISLLLVVSLWLSTFIQFVPKHNAIANGHSNLKTLQFLVEKNWLRTVLWSVTFCLSLYIYSY